MNDIKDARILCDTGVVSRFLTKTSEQYNRVIEIGLNNIWISVVTRIELYNWLSNWTQPTKKERRNILEGIKSFPVLHINEPISKIAMEIADKYMTDKPADLLIGATAIYHKIKLYTLNRKHFVRLKDIDLLES